jgi:hypothetical protein
VLRRVGCLLALGVCLLATAAPSPGRAGAAARFGPTEAITVAKLERQLDVIASDALEGREALSPGFREAARYVAANLERMGATPAGDDGTFYQHVGIRRTTLDLAHASVAVDGQTFTHGDDFVVRAPGRASGSLVYGGRGWRTSAGDVPGAPPIRDRLLVTTAGPAGEPEDAPPPARDVARMLGASGLIEVASTQQVSSWARYLRRAGDDLRVVDRLTPPDTALPTILAGRRLVSAIFDGEAVDGAAMIDRATRRQDGPTFALSAGRRLTLDLPWTSTIEDTTNVVAVIPGSDPALRHEYVALGAHLDHIGRRAPSDDAGGASGTDDINNGADDDGSGVVALLQMAEAVASGPRPKRSLLFVWHTGEEEGSWGAKYFTAFPTVPIGSIVAQLNVDMIGRSRAPDDDNPLDAGLTGPDEVYIVGSRRLSHELGDVCDRVDREYLGLRLNYHYDAPDDPERIYERSDHYEYAQKGIPVAFFFTGLHADYHRPSDEVSRIDFVKLQKVARTVLATAWALANQPARPRLDAAPPGSPRR